MNGKTSLLCCPDTPPILDGRRYCKAIAETAATAKQKMDTLSLAAALHFHGDRSVGWS